MDQTLKVIDQAFDGKLVGSIRMKNYVCYVVSLLPKRMQQQVTKSCWFIGSMDDAWAFAFTGNDLKNQHLIFLSDALLIEDTPQIYYSIAHEIGHVMLEHRNSVLVRQTNREVMRQEREADAFAKKYLRLTQATSS